LTATPEPSTLESLDNTSDWQRWFKFETHGDKSLEAMLGTSIEWARDYKSKMLPRWLSIIGGSGSGKTHLCSRLFWMAQKKSDWSKCNFIPSIIYWPRFVQELRGGSAYDQRNDMIKWPVLFLDDIGAERDTTGFATDELNTLLGCRMGKWTLLTSNLGLNDLAGVDNRIASRMVRDRNVCVQTTAPDYSTRRDELKKQLGVKI
jgi:DNA replication protein DnaC